MKKGYFFYLFLFGAIFMIIALFFILDHLRQAKREEERQAQKIENTTAERFSKESIHEPERVLQQIPTPKMAKRPAKNLANAPFDIPADILVDNPTKPAQSSPSVTTTIEQPMVKAASKPVSPQTKTRNKTHANIPANIADYRQQIEKIKIAAPALYRKNKSLYQSIDKWINWSLGTDEFDKVGLNKQKVAGKNSGTEVLLTGYYTPIVKARRKPDAVFKYPIYKMPTDLDKLPSRGRIYDGVLAGKGLELAYGSSLMENFMMDVQGSAYIDFEDGTPLVYFSFGGKNGHQYSSIGRVLLEKGELTRSQLSMQSILAWADKQEETKLKSLLMQNHSFIFYKYHGDSEVKGSAGVPLIAKASVASDRSLIPTGSVVLVSVPLLDDNGQYRGKNENRLMVALDTGSAIKKQHLDLYLGIGAEAGRRAGYYYHYGPVWMIKPSSNYASSN